MSLQDDIFDVEAALDDLNDKSIIEAFARIVDRVGHYEVMCVSLEHENRVLKEAIEIKKRDIEQKGGNFGQGETKEETS